MFSITKGKVGLSFLTLLLFFLSSNSLQANDKKEAKKHFKAGLALLEAEDFEAASAEFETSINLYPTKSSLFNLANCYKAMHLYGQALNTINRLESEFGGSLNAKWRSEIETFKKQLETMTGKLVIMVNVDGAILKVDGKEVASSPLSDALVLAPGSHTIEVEKEGYETVSQTTSLRSQEKNTLQIELTIIDSRASDEPEPKPAEDDVQESQDNDDKAKVSGLFWAGLTTTILVGGACGVFLGVSNAKSADYEDGGSSDADLYDQALTLGKVSMGLGIGAGVLAVGTIIVLIVDKKKNKSTSNIETAVGPGSFIVKF